MKKKIRIYASLLLSFSINAFCSASTFSKLSYSCVYLASPISYNFISTNNNHLSSSLRFSFSKLFNSSIFFLRTSASPSTLFLSPTAYYQYIWMSTLWQTLFGITLSFSNSTFFDCASNTSKIELIVSSKERVSVNEHVILSKIR